MADKQTYYKVGGGFIALRYFKDGTAVELHQRQAKHFLLFGALSETAPVPKQDPAPAVVEARPRAAPQPKGGRRGRFYSAQ
jgi:hypothetical protein